LPVLAAWILVQHRHDERVDRHVVELIQRPFVLARVWAQRINDQGNLLLSSATNSNDSMLKRQAVEPEAITFLSVQERLHPPIAHRLLGRLFIFVPLVLRRPVCWLLSACERTNAHHGGKSKA